ncbi:MAG: SDR family NAD(P)-dependent oxidoreductase, partial [bacterium]|nr:SDR family NAD(P)-dependent oxidoreductase [bacterium]
QGSGAAARTSDTGVDFAAMVRGRATAGPLSRTLYAHAVVVTVEYALGRLLMEWGIRPQLMIGYSTGEYVAACLAGIISLEDMLRVVARRAQLIEQQPRGAMLSVMVGSEEVQGYLGDGLWLAAANSPQLCVIAGGEERIAACAERLSADGIACRSVAVERAFHTPSIAGIEEPFLDALAAVELKPPRIPVISNVTGDRLTPELARDPRYWFRHAVSPVRFAEGLATVRQRPERVLLEVGPGQGLCSFAQQHDPADGRLAVATLPGRFERHDHAAHLQGSLGKLWLGGVTIDWHRLYAREERRKVSLPTYPFERRRYWIEAAPEGDTWGVSAAPATAAGETKEPIERWYRVPEWRRRSQLRPPAAAGVGETSREGCWLVLGEGRGLVGAIDDRLGATGDRVLHVTAGTELAIGDDDRIVIDPSNPEHYSLLAHHLRANGISVRNVLHLWAAEPLAGGGSIAERIEEGLEGSFYSLLWLLQALGETSLAEETSVVAVTAGAQCVLGDDLTVPERATLQGVLEVGPQEVKDLRCCGIDLPTGEIDEACARRWAGMILREFEDGLPERAVALRGTSRWVRELVPIELGPAEPSALPLRRGGVYLITGGFGGLGRNLAAHLAEHWAAKLVLLGRSAPPAAERWDEILERADEDDSEYGQVRLLRWLAERGIDSLVITADVADREALAAAIATAREQFGPLHGVFHCAGTPGSGLILTKRRDACEAVFAPKIAGTVNLTEACAEDPLELVVYFSSVAALQGPLGQSDYAAANAFLDAYAHWQRSQGVPAISVNWGIWRYCPWQERLTAVLPAAQKFLRDRRNRLGIELDEGLEALCRVIALQAPQVAVSSILLEYLLEERLELDATTFQEPTGQPLCERPAGLLSEYVAPRLDSEQALVEIWGEALGIEGIGVADDFFELGGHSLVATRIMAEVSGRFGVTLSLRALFAAPTIEKLALAVEEQMVADLESMAELGEDELVTAEEAGDG